MPVVSESLCDLFNKSLFVEKFSEDWKIARIAPIFKNGAKDDRSYYRPISAFPFVTGLLRNNYSISFMRIWMQMNYCMSIKLVFNFCTRSLQLLASTNDCYLNVDEGKCTGVTISDINKAFNTVDHAILLKKLKMYGVTDLEHECFISYLNNRKQFCNMNATSSQLKEITCGVPQGSCLGPLLFLFRFSCINQVSACMLMIRLFLFLRNTFIN